MQLLNHLNNRIDGKRLILLAIVILIQACTSQPAKQGTEQATETAVVQGEAKIVKVEPVRPKVELTEDILYKLMEAEFAGQRGRLDIAVANYIELAKSTLDPKVVERATRISVYARDEEASVEAARIWVELDPLNPDPHQVLAVASLRDGDIEQSLDHLKTILDYSHGEFDQKLWMIVNLLGREKDKAIVMPVMEKLMSGYQVSAEALYAFAHIAARFGDTERARQLLETTLKLSPDNDNVSMSYISILQRLDRGDEAITWLENIISEREDNDFNLRLAYARLLTDHKRFDDARRQFEILSVEAPNNVDVLYALGLLYLQANRLDDAERYFKRLTEKNTLNNSANYYLGRISEERKDFEQASVWYDSVQDGENYFDAQIRRALVTAKMGQIELAREYLQAINTKTKQEKIGLVQAEAELLIEEEQFEEALHVYTQAIDEGFNADLLYARAMLAEKMDLIDVLEQDLRAVLEKEPDHPQALNALGYTLADRTNRYEEALGFVKRALELSPEDFYILDSMGWVLYRLGRLDEAAKYLRKAIKLRHDPEIAAHLGEVLWVKGDKKGAKEVWATALKTTPEDRRLLDIIKRFSP